MREIRLENGASVMPLLNLILLSNVIGEKVFPQGVPPFLFRLLKSK